MQKVECTIYNGILQTFIWDRGWLFIWDRGCLSETEGVYLRPRVFIWDRGCLSGITHIPRNSRTYIFNSCDKESNIYIFRYKSTMCSTLTRVSGNNLKGSLSLNNQRFKRYCEPNTLFYKWRVTWFALNKICRYI